MSFSLRCGSHTFVPFLYLFYLPSFKHYIAWQRGLFFLAFITFIGVIITSIKLIIQWIDMGGNIHFKLESFLSTIAVIWSCFCGMISQVFVFSCFLPPPATATKSGDHREEGKSGLCLLSGTTCNGLSSIIAGTLCLLCGFLNWFCEVAQ